MSLKASVSFAENMRLIRLEASTQPCFIGDWEWYRGLSVVLYSGQHVIMKLTYDADELSWAAVPSCDSQQTPSTNSVECLSQIDEGGDLA